MAARLYSAPIGENSVAIEPEKLEPDMSRANQVVSAEFKDKLLESNSQDTASRKTVESFNIFSHAASIAANFLSLQFPH